MAEDPNEALATALTALLHAVEPYSQIDEHPAYGLLDAADQRLLLDLFDLTFRLTSALGRRRLTHEDTGTLASLARSLNRVTRSVSKMDPEQDPSLSEWYLSGRVHATQALGRVQHFLRASAPYSAAEGSSLTEPAVLAPASAGTSSPRWDEAKWGNVQFVTATTAVAPRVETPNGPAAPPVGEDRADSWPPGGLPYHRELQDAETRLSRLSRYELSRRRTLDGTQPVGNLPDLQADALETARRMLRDLGGRAQPASGDLVSILVALTRALEELQATDLHDPLAIESKLNAVHPLAVDLQDLRLAVFGVPPTDVQPLERRASRLLREILSLPSAAMAGPGASLERILEDVARIHQAASLLRQGFNTPAPRPNPRGIAHLLPVLSATAQLLRNHASDTRERGGTLHFEQADSVTLDALSHLAARLSKLVEPALTQISRAFGVPLLPSDRVDGLLSDASAREPAGSYTTDDAADDAATSATAPTIASEDLGDSGSRSAAFRLVLDPDGRLDVGSLFDNLPAAAPGDREAWSRRAREVLGALRRLLHAELGQAPAFPPDHNAPPEPIPNRSTLTSEAADRFLREAEVALVELEALAPDLARLNQVIERLEALVEALTQRVAELTAQEREAVAAQVHAAPAPLVEAAVPTLTDSPRAREELVLAEERGKWRGRFQGYAAGGVEAVAIIAGTAWRSAAALRDYVDRLRSQKSRQNDA